MNIPNCMEILLSQVMKDEGRSKKPKLYWRNSTTREESSGRYNPRSNRIAITTGTKGDDHEQVFLHEICHWLTRKKVKRIFFYGEKRKKRSFHNKRFYTKLHILLERYGFLTEAYRKREAEYMKRSVNYL